MNTTIKFSRTAIVCLILLLVFRSQSAHAQLRGINFQAVAIDPTGMELPGLDLSGQPIAQNQIAVRFSILSGSNSGTVLYQESHTTYTDQHGLFSLIIGNGVVSSSGKYDSLIHIPWSAANQFLKVEIDIHNNGNFVLVSNQQFMAVPYAFYALNSGNPGVAGPSGAIGATGSAGAASTIAGPIGPTGSIGLNGNKGTSGSNGNDGATGPTGAASTISGPIGPTGKNGVTGATGSASTIAGPIGPTGAASTVAGPIGPTGAASTVAGPIGPTGAASTVAGSTGPTGAASTVAGPTGPTGAASTVAGPIGPTGAASAIAGPTGSAGATGPTGSITQFAMFFGLTLGTGMSVNDYAATVAVKTSVGTGRVPFPENGPASGSIVSVDASSFNLPAIGTYEITFRVHTTEAGQLQLELNGADLANTVAVDMDVTSGGHPIIGNCFITTTVVNSTLAVVNSSGNAAALTITPANGSQTHANAQSITIKQIQ